MNQPAAHTPRFRRSCQVGLSLVDFMVGLTLGLIVLLGATALLTSSISLTQTKSDHALLDEQSNMALLQLSQNIQQAGYGELNREKGFKYENPSNLSAVVLPLKACAAGFANPAAADFACAAAGSAALAAMSVAQVLPDALDAGLGQGVDCLGQAVPAHPITGLKEVVNHYFVQNEQLMCRSQVPDPSAYFNLPVGYPLPARALLSGVVAFQVRLGQDTAGSQPSGAWGRNVNADQVEIAPYDALQAWRRVVWVELCMVVRTETPGRALQAMRYTDCAGQTQTASDTKMYRVIQSRVSIRNALS